MLDDLLPRIAAAADEVAQARELLDVATRRRNELMVEAVDEGVAQQQVARAARISQPRLIKILSTPVEVDDDGEEEDR